MKRIFNLIFCVLFLVSIFIFCKTTSSESLVLLILTGIGVWSTDRKTFPECKHKWKWTHEKPIVDNDAIVGLTHFGYCKKCGKKGKRIERFDDIIW